MIGPATPSRHVIDLESNDSPHQNNAFHDISTTSAAIPDLAHVLAGFNRNTVPSNVQEACAMTAEHRDFGQAMAHFSFSQVDGITDNNASVSRPLDPPKACRAVKEKKARVAKPKIPKVKSTKKRPMTITARSVSAFAPAKEPAAGNGTCPDQPITKFLTPTRAVPDATSFRGRSTVSIKRPKTKGRRLVERTYRLLSPRTVQGRYEVQKLLYKRAMLLDAPEPCALGPSRLITMSKGHWHKSNRCPDGGLTDGGPQGIISNQEQLSFVREDDLINLTMLPTRFSKEDDDYASEENMAQETTGDDFPSIGALPGSVDAFGYVSTQRYLCDLVEGSSSESQSDDRNLQSKGRERLDRSLHFSDKSDHTSTVTFGAKRTRPVGDDNTAARNVSPRLEARTSPGGASHIILIDEGPEECESDGITSFPGLPLVGEQCDSDRQPPVDSLNEFVSEAAGREAHRDIVQLDISDDELPIVSEDCRLVHSGCTSASSVNHVAEDNGQLFGVEDLLHPPQTAIRLSGQAPVLSRQDNDGYWVVPDSEDEPDAVTSTEVVDHPITAHKNTMPFVKQPNFDGYSTTQLQTELSNYGFKISKNRAGMVGLLRQCWQAKTGNRTLVQTVSMSTNSGGSAPDVAVLDLTDDLCPDDAIATIKAKSPKKPRESAATKADRLAREKLLKDQAKAVAAQEKAAKKAADKDAKQAQKDADKEAAQLQKIESTKVLYRDITALLKSTEGHCWWVKILKYEPVILEDFIEWLKTSKAIEADVDTVRNYFDIKGVCCVKKITRKGKDRKRF